MMPWIGKDGITLKSSLKINENLKRMIQPICHLRADFSQSAFYKNNILIRSFLKIYGSGSSGTPGFAAWNSMNPSCVKQKYF